MDIFDDFFMSDSEDYFDNDPTIPNFVSQDSSLSSLPQNDMDMGIFSPLNIPTAPEVAIASNIIPTSTPPDNWLGNPLNVNPMDVDIMSGLPLSGFHTHIPQGAIDPNSTGDPCKSYEQMHLDKCEEIESMRDTAVQHYNEAKANGDIDGMMKWEAEANKQQGNLYEHLGTTTYGLPPKAPGINNDLSIIHSNLY